MGVIVVAIVGNAAEHSTAVLMALKNKMDLAIGIAIGSALQIALFVAPVLVLASYLRSEPMDLLFTTLEIVAVILSVMIARMVAEDGESNWLEGVMLLMIYAILGMAFFFLPEEPVATEAPKRGPKPPHPLRSIRWRPTRCHRSDRPCETPRLRQSGKRLVPMVSGRWGLTDRSSAIIHRPCGGREVPATPRLRTPRGGCG